MNKKFKDIMYFSQKDIDAIVDDHKQFFMKAKDRIKILEDLDYFCCIEMIEKDFEKKRLIKSLNKIVIIIKAT